MQKPITAKLLYQNLLTPSFSATETMPTFRHITPFPGEWQSEAVYQKVSNFNGFGHRVEDMSKFTGVKRHNPRLFQQKWTPILGKAKKKLSTKYAFSSFAGFGDIEEGMPNKKYFRLYQSNVCSSRIVFSHKPHLEPNTRWIG